MKFDRSNKFDLSYYGQVNRYDYNQCSFENGQVNIFGSTIYFAGDGAYKEPIYIIYPPLVFNLLA